MYQPFEKQFFSYLCSYKYGFGFYFHLLLNTAISSAKLFFLITNQKIA